MGRYGGKVLLRGDKVLVKSGFVAFLVVCVVFASNAGVFCDIHRSDRSVVSALSFDVPFCYG